MSGYGKERRVCFKEDNDEGEDEEASKEEFRIDTMAWRRWSREEGDQKEDTEEGRGKNKLEVVGAGEEEEGPR